MIVDKGIPIRNLYYLLAYAFDLLDRIELKDSDVEEFDNALDLLAALLEAGVSRQLKQGLHKEYRGDKDDLTALRGKVDIQGTIRNRFARKTLVSCEYDELSENNLFNNILKTAIWHLVRSDYVRESTRDGLKKEQLYFSEIDLIDPSTIAWSSLRFMKSNSSYRILISLCQLILDGMLIYNDEGDATLAPDIGERHMEALYERFLLRYYQRHFPELRASSKKVDWSVDDGYSTLLPEMKTDVTLFYPDGIFVIDAKYYEKPMQGQERFDSSANVRSGHLYQIFAYVKNLATQNPDDKVSGMLLYAMPEKAPYPDERYEMSGNTVFVRALDLSVEFEEIAKQLNGYVESFYAPSSRDIEVEALA